MNLNKIIQEELNHILKTQDLNEGLRENIVVGIMLLGGVLNAQSQRANTGRISVTNNTNSSITIPNPFGNDLIRDRQTITRDVERVNHLLKFGWELDSIVLDTIWSTIQKLDESTHNIKIKSGYIDNTLNYFKPGSFDLSDSYKNLLYDTLSSYQGQPFLNIWITASTDKQPLTQGTKNILTKNGFEATNDGLVQARAYSIKNYLSNDLKVNADSIHFNLKSEQGIGTDDEYQSGEFRFIDVEFNFVIIDTINNPVNLINSQNFTTDKTYHLSRQETKKSEIKLPIPSIDVNLNIFKNKKRNGIRCNDMR